MVAAAIFDQEDDRVHRWLVVICHSWKDQHEAKKLLGWRKVEVTVNVWSLQQSGQSASQSDDRTCQGRAPDEVHY